MIQYGIVALVAAVVTFALSYVVYKIGRKYRLHPEIRARDVHTNPTPRLGGVAMFGGVLVAIAVASRIPFFEIVFSQPGKIWAIVGAAFIIVAIGVADDLLDLDWMIKLAGQILTAGLLAWQGVAIASLPIGGLTIGSAWMSLALTVLAIVFVMNAVNFIDGLDGLVAGVTIIANSVFFLYSYLVVQQTSPNNYFNLASLIAAVTIGICVGFLPLNFHPAKLFMGDGGAYLVALLMATSAIAVTGQIDPVVFGATFGRSSLLPAFLPILLPVAILIVPFLDFALAVTRRLRAGKSPFSADRKHLHHRLLDMGHSHLHAVLIFYAWTAVLSVGALLFFVVKPWYWALVFIFVGLVVCAVLTLAPLSRRKVVEAAAQSTPVDQESPIRAQLDPLDEAADDVVLDSHLDKEPT
ncbi:MraY family glycosyltransferase [Amnibacterium flavum]|uniref:Undecaprenyl-phosphate alpha-N-acetylglucosaminyl 1-phosphate transferase n=1 Tax=Amnibacterium flavum TaxID=2173173 RepID=A0A2V1HUF9_9MICO|nr:MraY family glycosyltransferase [Amnibacterium flavum]PVZ96218.1 undecaprenyl-phosphate alpha-N-acetylglucosaminyl 1-phosphate transferase [Amnibacterium flavum]